MSLQPNREEAIVEAALALPPEQRSAYVEQACANDTSLGQLVEGLLQAHKQLGALRHQETATAPSATMVISLPATERPGDRIGRYKLLQQIGEGGCGVVYMAEQEEPVRRRVALKVIKLGMDTKQVIARFEAERQALALMDHPNIAKVLDGGVRESPHPVSDHHLPSDGRGIKGEGGDHPRPSDGRGVGGEGRSYLSAGRPYFVMELVKGIPITRYCDENKLDTRQRLHLFIQVCQAIQHAHQKGIIHRDIKPSNILVADHDGVAVPKVIDFGIAKATAGQTLTDKTLFTAFEQFIGTPAYMSPEQAKLSGLDIDTRSDIYSLGVLLYELLTGKTPFDAKRLVRAGLEEICRIIREEEPPRPSTKISNLDADEQTTVARQRQLEPPKLVGLIRGDLDWIVMKTLEKNRNRRYETANGLASDLRRFLNEEPVVARPPSNLYRFQKLVRRNKLAFGATAAVAASLIIGMGLSTWLFFKERKAHYLAFAAEKKTQTEANKSHQVAQFLKDMLNGVGPSVAKGRDTAMLKEILDKTAERVGKDLKNQPEVEGELRSTLGQVYGALGDYQKAETMFRASIALATNQFGPEDRQTLPLMSDLAEVLLEARRLPEALALYDKTVKLMKAKLGATDPETLKAITGLAEAYVRADRIAEALPLFEGAVKDLTEKRGPSHSDTLAAMDNLATAYREAGRQSEALELMREIQRRYQSSVGPDNPDTLKSMNNLALSLRAAGQNSNAVPLWEEAVKRGKTLLGADHPDTLVWMHNLALGFQAQNRDEEAAQLLEQVFAVEKKTAGPTNSGTLKVMVSLGNAYRRAHKYPEARAMLEEALKLYKTVLGPDHHDTLHSMRFLALAHRSAGQFQEAQPLLEEVVRRGKVSLGAQHPDTLLWTHELAVLYDDLGRSADALPLYEQAVNGMKSAQPSNHPLTLAAMDNLAAAYLEAGFFTNAEAICREKLQAQRTSLPKENPALAWTFTLLSASLLEQNKYIDAERLLRDCVPILERTQPGVARTFGGQSLLGWALLGQQQYAQAEPLLVQAYESLQSMREPPFHSYLSLVKQAGDRIVRLYEAWGKPDMAAEWQRKILAESAK